MAIRSTNALTKIIWSKPKTLWLRTWTEFAEEGRGGLTVRCAATELWKKWKCKENSKLKACDLLKDWKCLMPHIGGEPPLLESLVRTKVCKKLLIATLWPTSSSSQAWPRSWPFCFFKRSLNRQRLNAHMFYLSCLVYVLSLFLFLSFISCLAWDIPRACLCLLDLKPLSLSLSKSLSLSIPLALSLNLCLFTCGCLCICFLVCPSLFHCHCVCIGRCLFF